MVEAYGERVNVVESEDVHAFAELKNYIINAEILNNEFWYHR